MRSFYPHLLERKNPELPGQFALGTSDVIVPDGWRAFSFEGWTLAAHSALPVCAIADSEGHNLGWLIGHAITGDGRIAGATLRVNALKDWDSTCEQFLMSLTGRFMALVLSRRGPRVYSDAFAMLAAVFAPEAEMVASTSRLIPFSDSNSFDVDHILATDIPYSNSMYPLGLTPRHGVERILPNHYLDLDRWKLVRYWPKVERTAIVEPELALRRVAEVASRNIEALVKAYPVQCPLTAGRDSRLLLACSRAVADQMTFFTARFPGHLTGWRDVTIAKGIADRFGLRHSVLAHQRASENDLLEWVQRTGGEAGEVTGWRGFRTLKQVSRNKATLLGWAGDIVRPIYWKTRPNDLAVTASDIIAICGVPRLPKFMTRAEQWLASLPTQDPITVLDIVLAEQRGGCWTGVIEYAEDGYSLLRMAPLCNVEIVRTLQALPESYRRKMVFERDLIALQWPELLEFPFNEQVPVSAYRKQYFRGRQALADTAARMGRVMRHARHDPRWLFQEVKGRLSARRVRASARAE